VETWRDKKLMNGIANFNPARGCHNTLLVATQEKRTSADG